MSEEKKKLSINDYFKNMGLETTINKNTFTAEDAAKVFEQAARELREKADSDKKIKAYIGYAWNILQVGIKLL